MTPNPMRSDDRIGQLLHQIATLKHELVVAKAEEGPLRKILIRVRERDFRRIHAAADATPDSLQQWCLGKLLEGLE